MLFLGKVTGLLVLSENYVLRNSTHKNDSIMKELVIYPLDNIAKEYNMMKSIWQHLIHLNLSDL